MDEDTKFCPYQSYFIENVVFYAELYSGYNMTSGRMWLLNTRSTKRFCEMSSAILKIVVWIYSLAQSEQIMSDFLIISVTADVLAPLGARASAGTGMNKIADTYWNTEYVSTSRFELRCLIINDIIFWNRLNQNSREKFHGVSPMIYISAFV